MKTTKIKFFILCSAMLFLVNCNIKPSRKTYIKKDSIVHLDTLKGYNKDLKVNLPEPINLNLLKPIQRLSFTNIDELPFGKAPNYPNDNGDGFYGRYTIVEKISSKHLSVCGYIDVHKEGDIINSKFSDTNQVIWEICIASDILSVWDSIKVGTHRKVIEDFGRIHNGLCIRHGDRFLVCYFNNFSVTYKFENDKLKEFFVYRRWKK